VLRAKERGDNKDMIRGQSLIIFCDEMLTKVGGSMMRRTGRLLSTTSSSSSSLVQRPLCLGIPLPQSLKTRIRDGETQSKGHQQEERRKLIKRGPKTL